MIQQLSEAEVKIEGEFDPETETVSYRVFAPGRFGRGSFHCIAGILSGLRMNILAAQVCTTSNGVVIAYFRVTDNDFTGPVPQSRIEDVAVAIGDVLTAKKTVESIFRRSSLYRLNRKNPIIMRQDPKVGIDNDCSERFTVVDVFATDTQGLLYTLAHTLFNYGLTVHLARIATNIDQVVDVFYVLDEHQRKLEDPERLEKLKASLLEEIKLLSGS
jgi:[protein-PII] uridylyltransferase